MYFPSHFWKGFLLYITRVSTEGNIICLSTNETNPLKVGLSGGTTGNRKTYYTMLEHLICINELIHGTFRLRIQEVDNEKTPVIKSQSRVEWISQNMFNLMGLTNGIICLLSGIFYAAIWLEETERFWRNYQHSESTNGSSLDSLQILASKVPDDCICVCNQNLSQRMKKRENSGAVMIILYPRFICSNFG